MKRQIDLLKGNFTGPVLLIMFSLLVINGFSSPVTPSEAIAIADVWYAMELNSGYLKITETEIASRFASMGNHQVQYMVSKDDLVDEYPAGRPVLAYIVKYEPDGFVVVSGDDRIEPIMVCSAESRFRWDDAEENFLRYYLGKVMPAFWKHMPANTHKNWSLLRAKLTARKDDVMFDDKGRAVYAYWKTAPWDQEDYYNDTCVVHNGGYTVPTGCVATAMAIKMKFHGWPATGNGSHSYSDTLGYVQYSHSVNFGAQSYNWNAMPDTCLTGPNSAVARIMYHCGVSVDMNYEVGGSGAYTTDVAPALNAFFRYRGTKAIYDDTLVSTHVGGMKTSIIGMLPVEIGYYWIRSDTLIYRHAILADGYRDDIPNQWHVNVGWNGSNDGWYKLDSLPPDTTGIITISCPYGQPDNWVYIDANWAGSKDGRILYPYWNIAEGYAVVPTDGELMIKTATYTGSLNVPITLSKAIAIRAYAGDVLVGGNFWLKNYHAVKLHGNGQLQITPAKAGK